MEQPIIGSDLIRGHIDTIILHTLLDSDKYAQQISEDISNKSENKYQINQATLYSSLKRLETLKLVSSYWNDSEEGRRKYFKITEEGKETVKTNLFNWSHSKNIIDKLIDDNSTTSAVPCDKKDKDDIKEYPISDVEDEKINFRGILNELISSSIKEDDEIVEELVEDDTKNENSTVQQEKPNEEKLDFNKTLANDYIDSSKNNIDFGDIAIKASEEGYKIRISSKQPTKKATITSNGNILINKLNLILSNCTLLLFIVEVLILSIKFKDLLKANTVYVFPILGIILIYPIISMIIYLKSPLKTSKKKIYPSSIFTALIVTFNLLLITVAVNLLIGTDFYNQNSLLLYVIIPSLFAIDIFVYFLIRYSLSKLKTVILKTKSV